MDNWIKKIIKKYADMNVLDYCLDCDIFVIGKSDVHFNHSVVKIHS
jgi:hypothetical protein